MHITGTITGDTETDAPIAEATTGSRYITRHTGRHITPPTRTGARVFIAGIGM